MKSRVLTPLIIAVIAALAAVAWLSKDVRSLVQPQSGHGRSPAVAGATLDEEPPVETPDGIQTATFGAGCFWCTEAVFGRLEGVESVTSGYSGGRMKNPSYQDVGDGISGHAEVVQITYDSAVISYAELLEVFWKTHDPTTLNRQGADRGTQYRSAIFYHNETQQKLAEYYKRKLDAAGVYSNPIVTEISAFTEFYPAEDYHQSYFTENPNLSYCRAVIAPKIDKLKRVFGDKLKRG
jgi:peptide-methionine (S)-S-oxide reductase